jgi:hypothetical protein
MAVVYNARYSNTVGSNSFWMQGGSVQIHGQFWRGLGVVADVSGQHTGNMHGSGVGLDLVTATFGPRYTYVHIGKKLPVHHPMSFYGQGLVGVTNGFNSIFPGIAAADTSTTGLALVVGGGMNIPLSRHFAVRAFDADWLYTQLPNSTNNVQNSLRLGSGIIFRF